MIAARVVSTPVRLEPFASLLVNLRAPLVRSRGVGVFTFLVALQLGCVATTEPSPAPIAPVAPVIPVTAATPDTTGMKRVVVTTVTTGVRLDPDGYGVLNDEWDYDVGDGMTVVAPTNGMVVLYLRSGAHVLSLVGVARNCGGDNLSDRPITVERGVTETQVEFRVVCRES